MRHFLTVMAMATLTVGAIAQNKSGLRQENFDKSVRPQDDFYQYATGGWQKKSI